MLVEDIDASVSKTPKEKEACDQDEWDDKSLVDKLLPVAVYRKAIIHIQIDLVNTRLS
jgi:hypothetical protein